MLPSFILKVPLKEEENITSYRCKYSSSRLDSRKREISLWPQNICWSSRNVILWWATFGAQLQAGVLLHCGRSEKLTGWKRGTSICSEWLQNTYFCFRKTNNSHLCPHSGMEPTGSRRFPGSLLFFDSLFWEVFSFLSTPFFPHWGKYTAFYMLFLIIDLFLSKIIIFFLRFWLHNPHVQLVSDSLLCPGC